MAFPRKVLESRGAGNNFDLFEPEVVTSIFGDGIANISYNFGNTHAQFFRTQPLYEALSPDLIQTGTASAPEQRLVTGVLTLPTHAFILLAAGVIIQAMKTYRDHLNPAEIRLVDQTLEKLREALK